MGAGAAGEAAGADGPLDEEAEADEALVVLLEQAVTPTAIAATSRTDTRITKTSLEVWEQEFGQARR